MKFRPLRLLLIATVLIGLSGCASRDAVPEPTTAPEIVPDEVVVFIGDSYTSGLGATSPSTTTAHLLAQHLGWNAQNLAQGSTGYTKSLGLPNSVNACQKNYCPSYTELLDFLPLHIDTIVIFGGRNQLNGMDGSLVTDVAAFYSRLRLEHPDTRIIATNPLWDASAPPAELATLSDAVKTAALAVDAEYVDIGQPLIGHPELLVTDDIHPNDAGQALLADRFATAIREYSPLSNNTPPATARP